MRQIRRYVRHVVGITFTAVQKPFRKKLSLQVADHSSSSLCIAAPSAHKKGGDGCTRARAPGFIYHEDICSRALGRGQAEKNAQKLSVEILRSNLYVRKSINERTMNDTLCPSNSEMYEKEPR